MLNRVTAPKPSRAPNERPNNVIRLPLPESDVALVAVLRTDPERGKACLFDRYAADVERVLCRVLGPDNELTDLLHDVFIDAITGIHALRDENALRHWITGIAVYKARRLIRRRKLQRLVRFIAPSELPDMAAAAAPPEVSDALRHTYEALAQLPTDDRIAFTLRFIDGMELAAMTRVLKVSLATVKRRVSRAQQRFVELARQNDALAEWLERGTLDR